MIIWINHFFYILIIVLSTILPFSIMNIAFFLFISYLLCDISIEPHSYLSNISLIIFSLYPSNADVTSSNKYIIGLLINALPIPILCFCPPDICIPRNPTSWSNPLLFYPTILEPFTLFSILTIYSSLISKLYFMFYLTVPLNNIGYCIIRPNKFLKKWIL